MSGPVPPADLARRAPLVDIVPTGARLYRLHDARFDPIHFDRSDTGRFNAPDGRHGVLYAARHRRGGFAETFLRHPGRTLIAADLLARKSLATLATIRPLRLARLAGAGLARLGATAEVAHAGPPYAVPQAWAAALHDHPGRFDGIAYNARHDDEQRCYAIFDRAADAIDVAAREPDLDADWFWEIAELYGVGLAP